MKTKLYINGLLVNDCIDKETPFVLACALSDAGVPTKEYSDTLTLWGEAAKMVYDGLVVPDNCGNGFFVVEAFDECCTTPDNPNGKVYTGLLKGKDVLWCCEDKGCKVDVSFTSNDENSEVLNCLNNTSIWESENDEFINANHPLIPYCIEARPTVNHVVRLLLGSLVIGLLVFIFPLVLLIVTIICLIVNAINAIPFITLDGQIGTFCDQFNPNGAALVDLSDIRDFFKDIYEQLQDEIIGCGRVHPSPYLRNYLKNGANNCGKTFKSSIYCQSSGTPYDEINAQGQSFNPYYCASYFFAPVKKGLRKNEAINNNIHWIHENRPNKTLPQLLKELEKLHYGTKARIKDNCVIFEPLEWFNQNCHSGVYYDDLENDGQIVEGVCFEYNDNSNKCKTDIKYTQDAIELMGNEALQSGLNDIDRYSNIYDWCFTEGATVREDTEECNLPFGAARFRNDTIDEDSFFKYLPLVSFLGGLTSIFNAFGNFGMADAIRDSEKYLLLAQGTTQLPKLLVIDKSTPNDCALVYCKEPTNPDVGLNYTQYEFNTPYYLEETINIGGCKGLYENFWYKYGEDLTIGCLDFEFTVCMSCELLERLGVGEVMDIKGKTATVTSLSKDFTNRLITVKGYV